MDIKHQYLKDEFSHNQNTPSKIKNKIEENEAHMEHIIMTMILLVRDNILSLNI